MLIIGFLLIFLIVAKLITEEHPAFATFILVAYLVFSLVYMHLEKVIK